MTLSVDLCTPSHFHIRDVHHATQCEAVQQTTDLVEVSDDRSLSAMLSRTNSGETLLPFSFAFVSTQKGDRCGECITVATRRAVMPADDIYCCNISPNAGFPEAVEKNSLIFVASLAQAISFFGR